jgi:hypothetical protein
MHINRSVPGTFGGAMCLCVDCERLRHIELTKNLNFQPVKVETLTQPPNRRLDWEELDIILNIFTNKNQQGTGMNTVLKDLKRYEKLYTVPYCTPTTGKTLIGYGININEGITEIEANWLLNNRVNDITRILHGQYKWFRALNHLYWPCKIRVMSLTRLLSSQLASISVIPSFIFIPYPINVFPVVGVQ